jgi:hypothetical protein
MKDFIGQVAGNPSCCPDLDLKTRVIGFVITFVIGFFITLASLGSFFALFAGGANWFAIWYTLGNLISLSSTFFLIGPKSQCKNMLKPVRATVSLIFIGSMIMTLVSAFFFSKILTVIFVVVQFCALVWYVLSYIPYGRECCKKCLKSCCCDDSDEKQDPII